MKHMFDLRSSSVTTRQSSSELDSALAAPSGWLRLPLSRLTSLNIGCTRHSQASLTLLSFARYFGIIQTSLASALAAPSVRNYADISIRSGHNPNVLLVWMILYSVRSLLPKSENSFYLRNTKLFYLEDECGTSWNAWPNQTMAHKRCTTFSAFIPFADSFYIVLSSLNDYFCS